MAVLVIGTLAALLIGLSLGLALYVEFRALRGVLAHGNKTRVRVPDASDTSERSSWLELKQGGGVGLSTRPPAGPPPQIAVPRFAPTMASMPTQAPTISAIVETRELAGDAQGPWASR